MGTPQPFQILKMDRARGDIVVSRRAVLEETRAEQRSELIQGLKEGMILDGVVKNITDYGRSLTLAASMVCCTSRTSPGAASTTPSEALTIGQQVKVQVIRFNSDTQRISLGMKRLEADPWEGVAAKYPPGAKYSGRVTNITDYRAPWSWSQGSRASCMCPRCPGRKQCPSWQDRLHQPGSRRHGARR